MPGRSPHEALQQFLVPLRESLACVASAHITLSPRAHVVGETHMWSLGGGEPVALGGGSRLEAQMHFEIRDHGQSAGDKRFKVSTSGYLYALLDGDNQEQLAAHWHPTGKSHHVAPHWHIDDSVLAPTGVFLARAPIPSPRVSFEAMIRYAIESGVEPRFDDWSERLSRTEAAFEQHKSW